MIFVRWHGRDIPVFALHLRCRSDHLGSIPSGEKKKGPARMHVARGGLFAEPNVPMFNLRAVAIRNTNYEST
jgi:hypothetical protein